MNRQSNHSCIITMTILAVLVLAPMASGAEDLPSADLGWGAYVCDPYSTDGAGPDEIRVKAKRRITPEIAFAFPDDRIQIAATQQKGDDIKAADAIGREADAKVVYVVFGLFLRGAGGQGQQAPIPLIWHADFRPSTDPVVLVLRDMNSPVGTFDGKSGDPGRLYCKAAADVKGDVEFWLLEGTDEYNWAIGTSNGKLNTGNHYTDSARDLAVGTHTLTVTKAGGFERKINFAVVAVSLYKKNSGWSAEWVLKPTPDLFTLGRVAGIQIEGPGPGKEIKARMWTSADPSHVATSHEKLDEGEDPWGVYRNEELFWYGRWPRFYSEWHSGNQRLKIVDEADKLHVYPMIGGVKQEHLEVSQKVDLAEVAAMDATASNDAWSFHGRMIRVGDGLAWWLSVGFYIWSVESHRTHITDDNCVAFGKKADIFYLAGHGNSTKYVGVYGPEVQDNPDHPLGNHNKEPMDQRGFQPSDIGSEWANGELEWLVLAACSQLYMATLGSPVATDYAVKWAEAAPKVHAILGYRGGSPSGPKDENIAARFVNYTLTKKFVEAWLAASRSEPDSHTLWTPWNVAALVQLECVDDKWHDATKFPSPETAETRYKFYWYDTDVASATYGELKEETFNLP